MEKVILYIFIIIYLVADLAEEFEVKTPWLPILRIVSSAVVFGYILAYC